MWASGQRPCSGSNGARRPRVQPPLPEKKAKGPARRLRQGLDPHLKGSWEVMSGEGSREKAGPFRAACIPRNTPASHFPSSPAELQGPSALLRPGVELKPEACRGLCEGEGEQTHPHIQ